MHWIPSTLAKVKKVTLALFALLWGGSHALTAQAPPSPPAAPQTSVDPSAPLPLQRMERRITNAQRKAAADRAAAARTATGTKAKARALATALNPQGVPDYLGGVTPNYANSPILQKFVHTLPGLGKANANDLGQFIPVAVPDTTTFPGSDYYTLGLQDYSQQLHKDLPKPTRLRGYADLNPAADGGATPHYLGPFIFAKRDRPVRVKFTNQLGTGAAGNLFLPVDTSMMGAGAGPNGGTELYTQNRALLHLHGGATPWISDGTPHQWITPAGETTSYPKGAGQQNVPDMPDPGAGSATYYYTNQQSGRMMFYHDHSYGLTRLNVYAGEAAGYIVSDPVEDTLIDSGLIPGSGAGVYRYGIPLVIQDKTFVPDTPTLIAEDPTWDTTNWGQPGDLWFPHVYMPNQNPNDISGANAMGRWDYGPWFWPPVTTLAHMPNVDPATGITTPNIPNPSLTPEAFMDTPLVNGTPYPVLNVQPQAYRFRILNAANDRTWNLSFFQADPANPTEVRMVSAAPATGLPANWPTDGRDGGVPDPTLLGPSFVQIGTEGGLLPTPAVIPPTPIGYNYNRRDIVVLNVSTHGLMLGPAERADVIVDFSAYAGKTLILYNDGPAPIPAFDSRYDYYTGDADQRSTGGAAPTLPGYGPNTRTLMQIVVAAANPAPAFDVTALTAAFTGSAASASVFGASQEPPLLPQATYGSAYNTTLPDTWSRIQDTSLTYTPMGATAPVTVGMQPKAIQELFELDYGRMNATLGVELPFTNFNTQTTIPLGYVDPLTEVINDGGIQIWKITHNGVDTHFIHFHLFNVQLINRVGWDGAVRLPDPNEIGWKETVRMNPLEDCIVALQPLAPVLPFDVPDSIRPLDPTMPVGAALSLTDPATGNAFSVTNALANFGWEYVWHCHILGHEENDMMRPIKFQVPAVTFSGTVKDAGGNPLQGVTIQPSGGMPAVTTDANGAYSFKHSAHWAGTVTAILAGYLFTPASYSYSDVVVDQANQNFVATALPLVAGTITTSLTPSAPLAGVTVTLDNGGGSTVTDANGQYQVLVPSGWTGNVVPSLAGYMFAPAGIAIATPVTTPTLTNNFKATPVVTLTGQITAGGTGLAGVTVAFSNGVASVTTDAGGTYTLQVPAGWTGVATPTLAGYTFSPASRTYTNVATSLTGQDYAATAVVVLSGNVSANGAGVAGVTLTFSTGQVLTTDAAGNYTVTLPSPYTGTVVPSKANFTFTPASRVYAAVTTSQAAQNFAGTAVVTFSGQVLNGTSGLANVTLTAGGLSALTDAAGRYTLTVPAPFTGALVPSLAGYVFTPASYSYAAAVVDQPGQNFTAQAVVTISGQVLDGATGLAGATVTFTPGGSVTTNGAGAYTITLPSGYTGTATASMAGYAITPAQLAFTSVTANISGENFTATPAITVYGLVSLNTNPLTPLAGVTVTFSNGGGTVVTDATGIYRQYVPIGWSGTVTPSLAGYAFTPVSRTLSNLRTNPAGQNFTARTVAVVSGNVSSAGLPVAGARVFFSNLGSATTDASGNYSMTVNTPYTGTVTATFNGLTFSPATVTLTNLTANTANVNFVSVQTITGQVTLLVGRRRTALAGATLTLSNGGGTVTTNGAGTYTATVPTGWTGSLTPSYPGRTFTPAVVNVTNLRTNLTGQNFTAQ